MSKIQELKKIFQDLEVKVFDIMGSTVIRTNGLVIVSALPGKTNERILRDFIINYDDSILFYR
ncbi:MAG: hypothetical protein ACFFCE_18570 [Promethearchaeota archaeon]